MNKEEMLEEAQKKISYSKELFEKRKNLRSEEKEIPKEDENYNSFLIFDEKTEKWIALDDTTGDWNMEEFIHEIDAIAWLLYVISFDEVTGHIYFYWDEEEEIIGNINRIEEGNIYE